MKADDDGDTVYSYEIANSLLKYGFDNFYYQRIAEAGQYVCDVPVRFAMPDAKSDNSTVRCIIPNDVFALTRSDITAQDDLKYRYYFHNDVLDAPVNAGDIVGGVDIIYNGEIIGNEKLVVAENVSASGMLVFFDGMKSFFIGRFFLLCVAFTVISIAAYCFHERRELRRKNVKRISYKNYY
jgi:D-alanyl-D-alanine carboxypeptidase (penicillin-binding protein 5/6)